MATAVRSAQAGDDKKKEDEKLARSLARQHNRLAEALREWQNDPAAIARTSEFTFKKADKDMSGFIERNEVGGLVADIFQKSGVVNPPGEDIIAQCWKSMDANNDGKVSLDEWTAFLKHLSSNMLVPENKPVPQSRAFNMIGQQPMMQQGMIGQQPMMQQGMIGQQRPMMQQGMIGQQRPMMQQGMVQQGMMQQPMMQQGMMQQPMMQQQPNQALQAMQMQMQVQNMQNQQQMQVMQMQNQMQMNNMMMMKAMGSSSWSSSDYFRRRGHYRPRNHRRYNRPGMMWHGHGGHGGHGRHGHGHGGHGGGLSIGFGFHL